MFLPMVTGEKWRSRSVFLETISLLYGTRKQFSNFCTTAWSGCNFWLVLMAALNGPRVTRRGAPVAVVVCSVGIADQRSMSGCMLIRVPLAGYLLDFYRGLAWE